MDQQAAAAGQYSQSHREDARGGDVVTPGNASLLPESLPPPVRKIKLFFTRLVAHDIA
jgi:hypothetical protein